MLFQPSEGVALRRGGVASTKDYLVLNLMDNVVGRMQRLSRKDGGWVTEEVPVEANGTIGIVSAAEDSNLLFFQFEGFLRPDTLFASQEAGTHSPPLPVTLTNAGLSPLEVSSITTSGDFSPTPE